MSEVVRAKRKETKILPEMFDTKPVAIKLPARVVVRGVRKEIAEKDSLKPKVVNRAGKAGVELDALTRVRVRLWLDAVTERAGCAVAELPVWYEMPDTARFDLYDALRRKPHPSTLQAIDVAEAKDAARTQPFRGTSLIYLHGPRALELWRVLEGKQRICRNVLNDELWPVFSKAALRWGVPFSKKVDALMRAVPGADSTDMLNILNGDDPHPVTLQFGKDIGARDADAREIAIDAWQSHVVTAIAVWQIAQVTKDSFLEVDFLLLGMLAGPLEVIFPKLGNWLRAFVHALMLEKTGKKNPPERHAIIKGYVNRKM